MKTQRACVDHGRAGDDSRGYARIQRGKVRRGAHIWAVLDSGRTVAPGQVVRHLCNNPRCVNPDHLVADSQSANIRQMYDEGRGVNNCGSKNGMAKLSEMDILELRKMLEGGATQSAAARCFNISSSTVSLIVNGKRRVK